MRTGFGIFLVVLGCLLAAPAVAAYALAGEVTSQERYLEAVTPLADEPAIKQSVTTQLTDAVAGQLPEQALPLVRQSIAGFVESPDFKRLWVEVNKEAHPEVLAMLRGEQGGGLAVKGDAIVLNLKSVAADVKQRMIAEGVPLADQIPEVDASVQLMSSESVRQLVPAFDLLEKLSVALPIVVIVLLLGGIVLAERRGRALIVAGVGLVVMMLLLVLLQFLARSEVTARAPDQELAGTFYDALTSQIMTMAWLICGVGGVAIIVGGIISASQAKRAARTPAYEAPRRRSYPR